MAALVWRAFGWRRALAFLAGGYLVALLAEWSSTAGWGIPFGVYHYRPAGLRDDLRPLGVPLFDSLSFTWLAFCSYTVLGRLGARGWPRPALTAVSMVAVDLVVDPVALRGGHWWLGSIYGYPPGTASWFGVSLLNYVGWLVVGLALALWARICLGDFALRRPLVLAACAALLLGVFLQSGVLAVALGVGPSLGAAVALLALAWAAGLVSGARPPETALLVACALDSEAAAARRGIGGRWEREPCGRVVRWRSLDRAVEVWATGAGPHAAAAAAGSAPGLPVLVAGVAGALDDSWAPGDVGLGESVRDPDGSWHPLHLPLPPAPTWRVCRLASAAAVADGDEARRRLRAAGADLVEMETAAWASRPALRVTALRAVVDTPKDRLGPAAGLVAAGDRSPRAGRVALSLLAHPGALPGLWRLGGRQRQALAGLAQAVATGAPLLMAAPVPGPLPRSASPLP